VPQLSPHPCGRQDGDVVSVVWVVNSDGGARGNPGPGGAGIVLTAPDGAVACRGGAYLGQVTNNVAEYQALLWAMRAALAHGARNLVVRADSELVVRQMKGEYRVKNAGLKPLFLEAQQLRREFDSVVFEHVRREDNCDADALANDAMDAQGVVGDAPDPPSGRTGTLFD
jgi:ribonuclease HI